MILMRFPLPKSNLMKHLLVAWSFVSIVLTITEMLMYPAQTLATTALSPHTDYRPYLITLVH